MPDADENNDGEIGDAILAEDLPTADDVDFDFLLDLLGPANVSTTTQ